MKRSKDLGDEILDHLNLYKNLGVNALLIAAIAAGGGNGRAAAPSNRIRVR